MKQTETKLVNNILNSMSEQEITLEISRIENALIGYGKKEFLASGYSLTEKHYESYLNRMKSYENRKGLLTKALEKLNKIKNISNKYNLSTENSVATVAFFNL